MPPPRPRPETTCARSLAESSTTTPPLVSPPHLSVVYRFEGLDHVDRFYQGEASGHVYARDGHPNADQLAAKIAELEGAESALVCASGMAAEAAVLLTELNQGDHIAFADQLYGRTNALIARELSRFGVTGTSFNAQDPEALLEILTPRTRLVFVETLSNPLVRLADLERLAEIARKGGAKLIVDHTFAPLLCRPLELGADLLTHSATKLIGGHSDLTLGLVAGPKAVIDRAASVASTFGLTGNPFESWLALRGAATLPLRSARACANALELAGRLQKHPAVLEVHYPGLATHPDHELASKILEGGFGIMATIDLGTRDRADAFIKSLRHIPFAPSLGDVATTLSHPATTSHRGQSPEHWARQGITPGLIRLSFGLEDPQDLWNDLDQALQRLP